MKALVYHGPGKRAWEEKPKPIIKGATDAIVKVTKTTICGTDLHIMKGDVPEVPDGLTLGHEAIFYRPDLNVACSTARSNPAIRSPLLVRGLLDLPHCSRHNLNLDKLWAHSITLTTRLVDTVTTPMLLKTVRSGKLHPGN